MLVGFFLSFPGQHLVLYPCMLALLSILDVGSGTFGFGQNLHGPIEVYPAATLSGIFWEIMKHWV